MFQLIRHIIFVKSLFFFNQISVSWINADHVQELNENHAAINTLHMEKAMRLSQNIKNNVDIKKQSFQIINQFLCHSLSDIYQLGVSIKNHANAHILENIAISKLEVLHNER